MLGLKKMLVEVEVVLRTEVVHAPDRPGQVVVKAGHLEEAEHRLPIHRFVGQATEVPRVTGPGLSLALAEDRGHAQDHEMWEGS